MRNGARWFLCVPVALAVLALAAGERPAGPTASPAEVVNGLKIELSAAVGRGDEPRLRMSFVNAGKQPFDLVEFAPLFLEVRDDDGSWRSFQHLRWDSRTLDDAHTLQVGGKGDETEPVSRFATLAPGEHVVRVSMALDRGMLAKHKSAQLWTGVVRSNSVAIKVPQ